MECGLQWKDITCWEDASRLTLTHEETLETAIADYCPDMGRVVETAGQLCLRSIVPQGDGVELRGTIQVTVLYTSEESVGLRSLTQSVPFSVSYNAESVTMIVDALRSIITRGEGTENVTGPVGTVVVISDVTQQGGVDVYLQLLAMVSVNLGVMNLLPIPGLDGSRLLFLLVEAIRRKPVRKELEGAIHAAGFILLMGLMLVLTYRDIVQIFMK